MRTNAKDFFTKEAKEAAKMVVFEHKGDLKHTIVSIDDIAAYNDIDNVYGIHGAYTSVSFQYSFVVTLTDEVKHYKKDCKEKGKEGKGKGAKLSTITADLTAVSRLYTLASYGFKIVKKDNGKYAIISPRYQKLEGIRRIMDYNELFFNFEYIACARYDGETLMDNVKVNHADIIQEAQKTNRHFSYKWISARAPKSWN